MAKEQKFLSIARPQPTPADSLYILEPRPFSPRYYLAAMEKNRLRDKIWGKEGLGLIKARFSLSKGRLTELGEWSQITKLPNRNRSPPSN